MKAVQVNKFDRVAIGSPLITCLWTISSRITMKCLISETAFIPIINSHVSTPRRIGSYEHYFNQFAG